MNLIKTYIATAIGLAVGIAIFLLAGGIAIFDDAAARPNAVAYILPIVCVVIGLAVDIFVRKKKLPTV
jgi:hypothetical protein